MRSFSPSLLPQSPQVFASIQNNYLTTSKLSAMATQTVPLTVNSLKNAVLQPPLTSSSADSYYIRIKKDKCTWFLDSISPSDTVATVKSQLATLLHREPATLRLHVKSTVTSPTGLAAGTGINGQPAVPPVTSALAFAPLEDHVVLEQAGIKVDDCLYLAQQSVEGKWEAVHVVEPTLQVAED